MLSTTINMHRDILIKIKEAAIRLDKSQRDIIVLLLMRIMRDHCKIMNEFTAVKYQPNDIREKWHCFHIKFKHDEYEYFIDLRKVCKCSVSLCIAIAVERYIDELTQKIKIGVDNYTRFSNYVLRHKVIEGVYCWYLYWGFPEKYLKRINIKKNRTKNKK